MTVTLARDDVCRSTIVVECNAQVALLNHHWHMGIVSGASATDDTFASDLDTLIAPLIKPVLGNGATYKGIMLQRILPTPTRRAVSIAGAGAGTAGGTLLPKQASAITTWYTPLTGRSHRGRTYWPFPCTAMGTAAGEVAGGTVTNYVTLANALLTLAFTGSLTDNIVTNLSLFNRHTLGLTIINTHVTNHLWATQKRRGSYGRPNVSPI